MSYYIERVQQGVDYIEERLDEPLQLSEVARHAGISQWHFQRMFRALTGEPLKVYIRSRRMARSLDRLLTTELRVLDIALLAGFESQESFARAFKKAFGMTPLEYRRVGDRSLFLRKVQLDPEYLTHLQDRVSLAPEILERPAQRLVGMRTLFYGPESEKNNVSAKLPGLWASFLPRMVEIEPRARGVAYGVIRQHGGDGERLEYHAAVETPTASPPADMVALELPAACYAQFAHRGPARDLDHTVNYVYSTWLAQSEYRHTYGPDVELYGAEYHPTSENSVIYYAIPIA